MEDPMFADMLDEVAPVWRDMLTVLALIVTAIAIVGIFVSQRGGSLLNWLTGS
jgi:hypothetical protein